ncbi:MAG: UDP-glucose/GDP-mannose dehydrogenase family protein [Gemmataceae bacterium]|nr:UDP-glucose/GDP-mannose dehydrogenase family protein [Gemmataceae bacterium]MCS7270439.1 UDP-glucose/GDP-mannose dehydrogenase family protein [Gemmataceae bacterium]MDW8242773.1 UDP-glucose/GDP-mannose dehydrogenase family protein [Thermogemmata sp.]
MKIAVVGTGYVGLVTGTCLAESGNDVVCVDNNAAKIAVLQEGRLPIYEPGLQELVQRNCREGRLRFTTDLGEAVAEARLIFVAVGTPPTADGSADLSAVFAVTEAVGRLVNGLPVCPWEPRILVVKSTVPVGTNARLTARLAELGCAQRLEVASNPEFLKEGAAVEDFMKPDRVVVGVRRGEVAEVLRELYAPFLRTDRPFLVMSPESAEMTKYVANAMLATKISFINEMANLCDRLGADIQDVRRGIGHDQRIGFQFLFPGPGYGGSCFPKDVQAIIAMGRQTGCPMHLMQAVDTVNNAQKQILFRKMLAHYQGRLQGLTVAIWGLAFKPRTDDIREAPSLVLIDALLQQGVQLRVHDPEAMRNVQTLYGQRLYYARNPYDAVQGADALVVVTEWAEFRNPDFALIRQLMKGHVIFDGRNIFEPRTVETLGFTYYGIGRGRRLNLPDNVTPSTQ